MKLHYLFILVLMSLAQLLDAQVFHSYDKLKTKNFADTIPFEFIENKIVIPAFVDGVERKLVFDTSEAHFLLKKHDLGTRHEKIGYLSMKGDDGQTVKADIRSIKKIRIGNLEFQNCGAVIIDTAKVSGVEFDGSIGCNILKKSIVKIDMDNNILVLTDRKDHFREDLGYEIKFKNINSNPLFMVIPFDYVKEQVLFDTSDTTLYTMSWKHYDYFRKRTDITDDIVTVDSLGTHLDVEMLQVGDYTFRNVRTTVQHGSAKVGTGILLHGNLIIDYRKDKITFIPHERPLYSSQN